MQPEPFDGRAAEMRESPWLASEDIDGLGPVTVTIERVYRHSEVEFEHGRKKPLVYAVAFEGKRRQLVLNGTNRKTLQRLFGSNVRDWCGERVTLFVDHRVKLAGRTVSGIRIREADPA